MRLLSFQLSSAGRAARFLALALVLVACGSPVESVDGEVASTSTTVVSGFVPGVETDVPASDGVDDSAAPDTAAPAGLEGDATSSTVPLDAAPLDPSPSDPASSDSSVATDATSNPSSDTGGEIAGQEPVDGSPFDQLITELASFVEAERGLEFLSRPDVQLLDEDDFAEAWLDLINQDAQDNAADYANFTDIYQTMGIISDDLSLREIWLRFGEAGVLGYYDTSSAAIRLRNGDVNALTRTTLVHELVHALEDQHFGLDRAEYADRDDEIAWAFSALIEGSARVIENRYRATYSQAELNEENAARNAIPRSVSLSEFEASFLELQFGRYNYGTELASELWEQGGASAIDRAFESPPWSSEQVLSPELFIGGVASDSALAAPPADGAVFEDGVWGQAAWAALLSDSDGLDRALAVADGWSSDWFVAWRDGSQTCVRIDVRADSDGDLEDFEAAIDRWASRQSGRQLVPVGSEVLRLTVCEG